MPLGMTLGKVFRHHLELRGRVWTQRHLAKQSGFHLSTIVKIENDDPSVGMETKARVAAVLGTTLDRLARDVTDPGPGVEDPSGVPAVRSVSRTRLDPSIPLPVPPDPSGEKESAGMRDVPHLETLMAYWLHLNDEQRRDLVDRAELLYHRSRRDVAGKVGG